MVLNACRKVVPDEAPFFIDVTPEDHCLELECFANVDQQVAVKGGSAQYGWLVQVFPRVLAEFEFHAIWLRNSRAPVDITPRIPAYPGAEAERVVLFLPDPGTRYTGSLVPNIQFSLKDDPRIHEYVQARNHFLEQFKAGEIESTMSARRRLLELQTRLRWKPHRNDRCPCGSREKFKNCHGKAR